MSDAPFAVKKGGPGLRPARAPANAAGVSGARRVSSRHRASPCPQPAPGLAVSPAGAGAPPRRVPSSGIVALVPF
eukprot:CAMPEP_0204321608 /NCGR_PEP_ID=MMETSP0469-20131031/8252_1 /ASSEMBLY_ACC=CAM_ASM_000384 /TAXON_ID=2969 /ORGANISM="Oxyrrhis marina" /LENGTH=74 /DNA_ID=CAMNT_0051302917 /DNA_START=70 /DNA_END=294 /DNA_ORIENTATION=-